MLVTPHTRCVIYTLLTETIRGEVLVVVSLHVPNELRLGDSGCSNTVRREEDGPEVLARSGVRGEDRKLSTEKLVDRPVSLLTGCGTVGHYENESQQLYEK